MCSCQSHDGNGDRCTTHVDGRTKRDGDGVGILIKSEILAQLHVYRNVGGRASCEECCDTTVLQAAQNQRIWILACADESNDRVDHQCDKEHGSHQYTDQTAIA